MERIQDCSGLTPWRGIHHLDDEMADMMIEVLKEIREAAYKSGGERIDPTDDLEEAKHSG